MHIFEYSRWLYFAMRARACARRCARARARGCACARVTAPFGHIMVCALNPISTGLQWKSIDRVRGQSEARALNTDVMARARPPQPSIGASILHIGIGAGARQAAKC